MDDHCEFEAWGPQIYAAILDVYSLNHVGLCWHLQAYRPLRGSAVPRYAEGPLSHGRTWARKPHWLLPPT